MQTRMLVSPADETVELAFAVNGVFLFALFFPRTSAGEVRAILFRPCSRARVRPISAANSFSPGRAVQYSEASTFR